MHRRRGQWPAVDRETVSRVLIHRFATRGSAPRRLTTTRIACHVGYPTITTSIRCQTANSNDTITNGRGRVERNGARQGEIEIEIEIGCRDVRHVSGFRRPGGRLLADSVKEVIQPQVPLRLPCYDFAPVTALAFGRLAWLPSSGTDFGRSQLPWRDGRCVQGPGTYSPRRS